MKELTKVPAYVKYSFQFSQLQGSAKNQDLNKQPWPALWLKNRMWPSGSSNGRRNSSVWELRS